jgi:hypothetical protein
MTISRSSDETGADRHVIAGRGTRRGDPWFNKLTMGQSPPNKAQIEPQARAFYLEPAATIS